VPAAAPLASRRALVAVGAGAALMAALVAVAIAQRGSPEEDRMRMVVPAAAARAPMPLEQEIAPAPILAPPAFDLGELSDTKRPVAKPGPTAEGSTVAPAASVPSSGLAVQGASAAPQATAQARPQVAPKPSPAATPPSAQTHGYLGERPGPGF
jgi:hypothetical protein